jgi:hypothetical protein
VRFTISSGADRARAVAFGRGTRLPVEDGELADATFALEINEWRGVSEPRLVLRHVQACANETAETSEPAAERATLEEQELVLFA